MSLQPKAKTITLHGCTMHCYRCSMSGHNSFSCLIAGVPFRHVPPKKAKTQSEHGVGDTITLDCVKWSSQSQPTQAPARD